MTSRPVGLMNSFKERQLRIAEKQKIILGFLQQEVWTTAPLVSELLGYTSPAAAYRTLKTMARERLLLAHTLKLEFGRPVTLWGLTSHGLAMAQIADDRSNCTPFHPSSLSTSMMKLQQHLDIQKLHVTALNSGWKNWTVRRHLPQCKGEKKPDAIATTPDDRTVAVILERTIKNEKHYHDAVSHHITTGHLTRDGICFFCPTEAIRTRVEHRVKNAFIHHPFVTEEQVQSQPGAFEVRLYSDMR
ncbi:hypothetical protein [Enterobacter asburiae]|uniref:hypothetical protein n=1 Tax=Enterobacter asburiae TaxID=61645 RepID=UPI003F54B409